MSDLLDEELDVPVVFRRRPVDIPGDMRPAWRIAFVALMLSQCCRGGQSSIRRLHVFNWCNRTTESRNLLRRAVGELVKPGAVLIRIEPSLARAIDFAVGTGVLERESKDRVKLTPEGRRFANEIMDDESILSREKEWALALGQSVTEGFVDSMFVGRNS
jgi:hypothetical protein